MHILREHSVKVGCINGLGGEGRFLFLLQQTAELPDSMKRATCQPVS